MPLDDLRLLPIFFEKTMNSLVDFINLSFDRLLGFWVHFDLLEEAVLGQCHFLLLSGGLRIVDETVGVPGKQNEIERESNDLLFRYWVACISV